MAVAPSLTVEVLKSETGINDQQLDHDIEQDHTWNLAAHFSDCDKYIGVPGLGLTESEKVDVIRCARQENQRGVQLALKTWIKKNPYRTYRSLIEILLKLNEGELAQKVCDFAIVCRFGEIAVVDESRPLEKTSSSSSTSSEDVKKLSINKKIKDFKERFVELRICTCQELALKGISPKDLRITLMTLPCEAAVRHEKFISDKYDMFQKAETVEDIFRHLNFYLSFLNYDLLAHIIKYLDTSRALRAKMKSYCKDMELFQKETMIVDILPFLPNKSDTPKDYSNLGFKVNFNIETTSLEDLEVYRKEVASDLLLPDFALLLKNVQKGCLLICWLVPSAAVPALKQDLKEKDGNFFSKFYIVEISIEEDTICPNTANFNDTHSMSTDRLSSDNQAQRLSPTEKSYVLPSSSSDSPLTSEIADRSRATTPSTCHSVPLFRSTGSGTSLLQETFTSSDGGRPGSVTKKRVGLSIKTMGYFDILLLGLNSQGKTTTADKLLIANPTGVKYGVDSDIEDISTWMVSSSTLESLRTRLKRLIFYRSLENPHINVNADHEKNIDSITADFELFSNETTKVRVLDSPGFIGLLGNIDQGSHDISLSHKDYSTSTMRRILQIQAALAMNFKRILYFLPCRDTLQFSNAALQQELQLMSYYFGRSIFESMVLVATLGPTIYSVVPKNFPVEMPNEELETSRTVFQDALKSFIPVDTPNPPIIFISLRETCESILDKVKTAEIANNDGLQLELDSFVCARCAITVGEKKNDRIACTTDGDWSHSVLYGSTQCHPEFVPKYTFLQKITHGIRNLIGSDVQADVSEMVCPVCNQEPGSPGCLPLGSSYKDTIIDHVKEIDIEQAHRSVLQDRKKENEAVFQIQSRISRTDHWVASTSRYSGTDSDSSDGFVRKKGASRY